jgi:DNA polymerase III epsilon subunit-like protein
MKLKPAHEEFVKKYIQLAKKLGYYPTRSEFISYGINLDTLRYYFGNFTKFKEYVKSNYNLDIEEEKPKVVNKINPPKILLFDIETAPILGYVWGLWENTLGLNQIHTDWFVLSWSAKWLDRPEVMYMDQRKSKKIENDKNLLKEIWKLLDEADIVVTQNGKKFDVKKLNARFILNGFQPPSPFQHIDTLKIAQKHFGFTSNKLEYLSKKLNINYKKQDHKKFPGFELWKECIAGNLEAWKEMETYNTYDVLALEEVYKKLIPWDTSNINFNVYHDGLETVCKCGSNEFYKKGFQYTKTGKFQAYQCKKCGAQSKDRFNLLTKEKRKSLKA